MRVQFCGVRGSAPATGVDYAGVGGATSCVAIAADGALPTLLLDGGTGLRTASSLFGDAPFEGTIILGHLHWDHFMGLPFFPAGDRPGARVRVLVPEQDGDPVGSVTSIFGPPLFPITPGELRGEWTFETYDAGTFQVGAFSVLAREIPHKGGRTMGLRVSDGRSSIAYLSDHAPHEIGPGADGLGALHPAALELARDVDVLIHDAQYTAAELPAKRSWGHAAADYSATLAGRAGARRVLLYHHDPARTDAEVMRVADDVAGRAPTGVEVTVAVEGAVIEL